MVNKRRKSELKKAAREAERSSFLNRMPVSPVAALALFNAVDEALQEHGCSSDFRLTQAYADEAGIVSASMLAWLKEAGAGCDCEVIANVEPAVEEALGPLHRPSDGPPPRSGEDIW